MAAKGYTSLEAVQSYLGTTFTGDQELQVTALLPIAEDFIDHETHTTNGWLAGPITNEEYDLGNSGHRLYLRSMPVASIQTIYRRTERVGDTPVLLTAGTDYELLNPAAGLVLLAATACSTIYRGYGYASDPAWSPEWNNIGGIGLTRGLIALVSYTPVQSCPPLISQCATEVVAYWMTNNIHPERYGVTSIKTDTQSTQFSGFAQLAAMGGFPKDIDRYFRDFKRVLF